MRRSLAVVSGIAVAAAAVAVASASVPAGSIVFAASPSRLQLFAVAPDGSQLTQLSHTLAGLQPIFSAWSPDERYVAYGTYSGIGVSDVDKTGERVIDSLGEALRPSWSPDSEWLSYTRDDGSGTFFGRSVWIAHPDGSSRRRIGSGYLPVWSPDGTRIAAGDDAELVLYDVATGARTVLASVAEIVATPTWSPDGLQVAYSEINRADGHRPVVHVVDIVDRRDRVIAAGRDPAWSPDGTRLAILREQSPPSVVPNALTVVRPDGSVVAEVAGDAGLAFSWSPDGRELAYERGDLRALLVARADGDGGRIVATAETNGGVTDVRWAPDGTRILFDFDRPPPAPFADPPTQLFAIDAASGFVQQLTHDAVPHSQPTSSADGKRLADVRGAGSRSEIELMNADGSAARAVALGTQPALSADGARIAYVHAGSIAVARADGRRVRVLARGSWPAWSPNSRLLAYVRSNAVWTIHSDGTHSRRLLRIPSVTPNPFVPAGAPLTATWVDKNHIYLQGVSTIIRPDGSHRRAINLSRALTNGPMDNPVAVAAAPHARAFAVAIAHDGVRLEVLPADGSPLITLTPRMYTPGFDRLTWLARG